MTDRDCESGSCGPGEEGSDACSAMPPVGLEISTGVGEQVVHGLAAMIASDVGVQVLPDALDAVGVGAVGGQKVEQDSAAQGVEQASNGVRLVHAVVVDDEMDAASPRV